MQANLGTHGFGKIGIHGYGMVGGSIAGLIKEASLDHGLVVVDANEAHAEIAASRHESVTIGSGVEAFEDCDLVLVSTYVGGVADDVCSILSLPKFKGLVVDTGSVKRPILEAVLNSPVDTSRYVPGHPMAGRNEPGPVTASADIMRDKVFLLCEHPDIRETAPDRVQAWLSAIGFRPYRIDAESHDAILSISSHLPHVVAYALGRQLAELGSVVAGEDIDALSGRSIRSILDFASPNFAMWESILFANRGAVLKQGRALSSSLDALLDAVEADDLPRLKSLLEQGSAGRGILFNETAS